MSDPRHFEELVASHGGRVHAYLARRAPRDADDLLAEVWLTAYAARHRFEPSRGEVGAWLFGIARNVLLSHHRRKRRDQGRAELVDTLADVDGWSAVDARIDADRAGPRLRAGLAAMPPDEREVLLLVAWEELSPTEAAGVLGIPPGTARSRLHRARARLADLAGDPTDDSERQAIR